MKLKLFILAMFTILFSSVSLAESNCDKYFKAIDQYVDLVTQKADKLDNVDLIKKQMQQAKVQMNSVPAGDSKEKACQAALESVQQSIKKTQSL